MIIYNFYCYTSNLDENLAKIIIFMYDKKFVKKYFFLHFMLKLVQFF